MSGVLVDTSVWIAFFRGDDAGRPLLALLDANQAYVNDLIAAELVPSLKARKEKRLVELLLAVPHTELRIDWPGIVDMQTANLQNGVNKVGIPDLLIAQNAIQTGMVLLSLDRHFALMRDAGRLSLQLA